ncbi:MAG: hypothetical protein IPL26_13225 [Leptospiraceae bacterium]|nr:hypothetical protein [Leptospiraceae bacterium]
MGSIKEKIIQELEQFTKIKRSINNYLVMLIERESEKSSDKAVKTVYGKDGVNINYS